MSDAIHYDHDAEARLAVLTFDARHLERDDAVTVNDAHDPWLCRVALALSDDESIALYEQLRATWAGYLAERDEAKRAVDRGVPLDQYLSGWKAGIVAQYQAADMFDGPDESFGAYVDSGAADLARDQERGK